MSEKQAYILTPTGEMQLSELAEQNGLTPSAVVEILVRQAHATKWSIAAPPKPDEALDFQVLRQRIKTTKSYYAFASYLNERQITTWGQLAQHGYLPLKFRLNFNARYLSILEELLNERNLSWPAGIHPSYCK